MHGRTVATGLFGVNDDEYVAASMQGAVSIYGKKMIKMTFIGRPIQFDSIER